MIDLFILTFIVYVMYFFVSINKFDKNGHVKKSKLSGKNKTKENVNLEDYKALPNEVKYFIKKYNVDLDKVNKRGLLKMTGYILGIDIAIICLIAFNTLNNIIIITIVSILLIIPVYLLSLKILAKQFKKRGLIKNV